MAALKHIGLRARLASYINDRTPEWNQANQDYRKIFKSCEMCTIKKNLECHDKLPYHLLTDAQKHDYQWLIKKNFRLLCRVSGVGCHISFGHCGDGTGYRYQPKIDALIDTANKYRKYCTT